MADTNLPDKWVRKALKSAFSAITVDSVAVPTYDMRAEGYDGSQYIILSTQSNTPSESKCGDSWIHTIEIQAITYFKMNQGSRRRADLIMEAVLSALSGLALDGASSMVINKQSLVFPGDFNGTSEYATFYRKILQVEMYIS
jgi:hypothetical protein